MDALIFETPVLFVDCQTTGATPEKGELLDLAWAVARAGEDEVRVEGGLLQLVDGLPPRISRLTGITPESLAEAIGRDQMRQDFEAALAGHDGPVVAHYARFERRFLDDFLDESTLWPRDVFCTHAIARRLLPELPRLGIRALSGYFGRSMHEEKRAAAHVRATARIWSELAVLLAEEGVEDIAELADWLQTTSKPKRTSRARHFPLPRDVRLDLPEVPGVYRMLGRDQVVLYVGKATSLKARVNSYYRGRKGEGERKLELVTQVWSLDVTPTETPLHAAILENREIKAHEPAYNRQFRAKHRDIAFANPLDLTSLSRKPDADHSFGPLPSLRTVDAAVWLLRALQGDVAELDFATISQEVATEGLQLFREMSTSAGFGPEEWDRPLDIAHLGSLFRAEDELHEVEVDELDDDETDGVDDGDVDRPAEDDSLEESREWSPDQVAEYCRWVARGLDRTARRVAAFRSFVDGDLEWISPVTLARHRVSWRRGRVEDSGRATHAIDAGDRAAIGADFDLENYDETAVLIGELRRLVRYEAELELKTPDRTWSFEDLERYFRGEG